MADSAAVIVRRIQVLGRVQGVGYRVSLERKAIQSGLTGWVRNRRDGTVEATLCGPEEAVDALIDWCHSGPPTALVTKVVVRPGVGSPDQFERFEVRPTA